MKIKIKTEDTKNCENKEKNRRHVLLFPLWCPVTEIIDYGTLINRTFTMIISY